MPSAPDFSPFNVRKMRLRAHVLILFCLRERDANIKAPKSMDLGKSKKVQKISKLMNAKW